MVVALLAILFLLTGIIIGWLGAERYISIISYTPHEFENIIRENPHPEIFDKKGKLNRDDYLSIQFEPGYDAEEFSPKDIYYGDEE